jgi:hypothetical protein
MRALEELGGRYESRPDLAPEPSDLASAGHQLLRTVAGALDILGELKAAWITPYF